MLVTKSTIRLILTAGMLLAIVGGAWLAPGQAAALNAPALDGGTALGFGLDNTSLTMAIAVKDFNNDLFPDVALVNRGTNAVLVFLNNQDGTFADPVSYPVGNSPVAVAVGFFNNDEIPDLAVVNAGSNNVSILLGNGDGAFRPGATVNVGSVPTGVIVEDFNEDEFEDLAVVNSGSGTVSVLLGFGNGTFRPPDTYAVGSNPVALAAEDFFGDEAKDLAVANAGSGTISILRNIVMGDLATGRFTPATTTPAMSGVGVIVAEDFDNDNREDLAIANPSGDTVLVLLGNGNGTFRQGPALNVGTGPVAIEAEALRGGIPPSQDIIVASNIANTVTVFLGTGTGQFSDPMPYDMPNGPSAVAAADFNGDAFLDVVVATSDNGLQVLFGDGSGALYGP